MVMSARARSVSTSYASFEAELEGAILQHTGAVDYYLETQAHKWSANHTDEPATPQTLHSVFIGDMNTSFWQAFTHRGEISFLNDGHYQMCGGRPPVASAQDAYKVTQLLRNSNKRRLRVNPLQAESRLEQYLQQDLQLYMDMREELDSAASECPAAVLSEPVYQQTHARTSSNGSFVRFPDFEQDADAQADDAAAAPMAVAVAAAMAAVNDVFSADVDDVVLPVMPSVAASTAARRSWDTAAATTAAAAAAVQAAVQQQQVEVQPPAAAMIASSTAAAATVESLRAAETGNKTATAAKSSVPFAIEDDEAIAAQKRAARAKLAELEGETSSTVAAPVPAGKATGKGFADEDESMFEPGCMHSSIVHQRTGGFSGLVHNGAGAADAFGIGMMGGKKGDTLVYGAVSVEEARRFLHLMLAGLVMCMVLLPAPWGLQAWTVAGTSAEHTWVLAKLQSYGSYLFVAFAAAILLYVLRSVVTLTPPLLHFHNPELEKRYLVWSNSGKLFADSMFQLLFLVVGGFMWLRLKHAGLGGEEQATAHTRILLAVVSMMGAGLPVVVFLLVRSVRYAQRREQLLAGSRLCSILALLIMQFSLPAECSMQLSSSMPFVALAQLIGVACMQVRLATFVPCQVLHLLVLLLRTQAQNPMLHFVQLYGGGLCLPCLLLHSMELYSRKAFLANFANMGGEAKGGVIMQPCRALYGRMYEHV